MFVLPKYTWDKDRELCKGCKHYRTRQDNIAFNSAALVMLCVLTPAKGRKGIGTCIDNRTRGPCGKEGRQFAPAEPVTHTPPIYHPKAPPTPP